MGKRDLAVNRMLERKEVFADLMNGIVFEGKQVIKPDKLERLSPRRGIIREKNGRKGAVVRDRDICMEGSTGRYSLILAGETQDKVHYAMPVRTILYDALEYTRQVQDLEKSHKEKGDKLGNGEFLSGIRKTDRLKPVLTIILYFGDGREWDGSRSLYEMLNIDDEDEDIEFLRKYIPDYKLNLVQADQIEDPKMFQTCLQQIFEMLKYRKDKKRLSQYVQSHKEELSKMDGVETMAAVTLLGEQKRLERLLEESGKEEEDMGMVSALTELLMDAKEEAKAEIRANSKAMDEIRAEALAAVKDEIRAEALAAVKDEIRPAVWVAMEAEVREEVEEKLKTKVREEVEEELKAEVREAVEEEIKAELKAEEKIAGEIRMIRKKLKQGISAEMITEWTGWDAGYVREIGELLAKYHEETEDEMARRYLRISAAQ